MGIMDKAKEAALQAKAKAEHVAQQGQAKVAEIKENREEGELYRALGEAVYAEQRKGGAHAAVDTALVALDSHFASAAADGGTPPATGDVPPGG
jgi:hypothetical protein